MRSFADNMNRIVEIKYPPERIISLVPSITELLFDLGLDNEIIGITRYCIHPSEKTENKAIVGGTENIDLQKISELKPDIIFAAKEENTKNEIDKLAGSFNVFICDIKNYDEALNFIVEAGELVNKSKEAEKMCTDIINRFEKIPHPLTLHHVAYLIWKDPFMTINKNTFINSMLEKSGYINVFADKPEQYPRISTEELQSSDPEMIFLASEPYPFEDKHIKELQKLLTDIEIKIVDGEIFSWYGSRMLHAPEYFEQLMQSIIVNKN